MSYNIPKDYLYSPIYNSSIPRAFINTHNHRRSRLESGNAFFRSKDIGEYTKYISIQALIDRVIIKFNPPPFLSMVYQTEEILIPDNNLTSVRLTINATSKLIELMEPNIDILDTRPIDVETRVNESNQLVFPFSPFQETYLNGGDGLPLTPSGIMSGPERSFVHINYGEDYNGNLSELFNTIYEWVGSSFKNGMWKVYYKN